MPSTIFGKWATWLLGLFAALLALFFGLVAAGQRGGETFFSNLLLTIPMLVAAASAIAAGGLGIRALFDKDRSISVFLSIVVGTFVLLYVILELAVPHRGIARPMARY